MVDLSPLFLGSGLAVRGMSYLKRIDNKNPLIRKYGTEEFAKILGEPLRECLFAEVIITDIFPMIKMEVAQRD